jgi:nucleoside-diphosphate-sugar epimerase
VSEILVTGGNGFVGRHVVGALLERGDNVRILALPSEDTSAVEQLGVDVHRGDICDADSLKAPMAGVGGVLHLAAMMDVWRPLEDYHAVNVTGTENVCRAALAEDARVVHVSSWTVYGMALDEPAREDFPLEPFQEPYAITKAAGDEVVQRMIAQDGLAAVIIRPGTFFGPGDQLHFARMADRLRAGKGVIVGRGDNALPFVYVTDVVQGLLLALNSERAPGQAYNITNDRPLTQEQLLGAIADEVGASRPHRHIPYRPLYTAGYVAERVAQLTRSTRQPIVTRLGVKLFGTDNRHSIEKARRELGFEPRVELTEGVRMAANWYRGSHQPSRIAELAVAR